jgi:hypothetical protein
LGLSDEQWRDRALASMITSAAVMKGARLASRGRNGEGLNTGNWKFDPKRDVDLRGVGSGYKDSVDAALDKLGMKRSDFTVTKWGKTKNGKSFPTEYRAANKAYIRVDSPTPSMTRNGPTEPHINYGGNKSTPSGHVFSDFLSKYF